MPGFSSINVDPAQVTAAKLLAQIQRQLSSNQSIFTAISAFIWQNSAGLTPQQAFNYFGPNAGTLVQLSSAYQAVSQIFTGQTPASPIPAGYAVAPNPDGTVTVTGNPPS